MRYVMLAALLGCPSPEPVVTSEPESAEGGELGVALDDAWMRDALDRGLDEVAAPSLTWVEHFNEVAEGDEADPRTDADGMVRDARRLCDEDRLDALRRLTEELRDKIHVLEEHAFDCEENRCSFAPVGEYDLDAILELRRAGNSFEIIGVARLDSATATDEYLEQADAWMDSAIRGLDPCPGET